MAILVDKERLEITDALNNEKHKMYPFAVVYDKAIKEMQKKFKDGVIHFTRPDRPKKVRGANSRGREMPNVSVPVEPTTIPLSANVVVEGIPGVHNWVVSKGAPEPLPGGLWRATGQKTLIIKTADLSVDMNRDPDLAFFLYKISKHTKKGAWKLKDINAEAQAIAEKENIIAERKLAVWKTLTAEKLPLMARAYGINKVEDKPEAILRQELERQLEKNDELKKINPSVKGTMDFIEEMKVTESVLLRAYVKRMIDEKRLTWAIDKYRVGDKVVCVIPAFEANRHFDYLCQWLNAGNNEEKLQEFVRDTIYKEYIEAVTDRKELAWLSKIAGVSAEFKKPEQLKQLALEFFCPV